MRRPSATSAGTRSLAGSGSTTTAVAAGPAATPDAAGAAITRPTVRGDLLELIRQVAMLAFVLIFAWLAFAAGALFLGQIVRRRTPASASIPVGSAPIREHR